MISKITQIPVTLAVGRLQGEGVNNRGGETESDYGNNVNLVKQQAHSLSPTSRRCQSLI